MQVVPGSLDHLSKVLEDRHWDESGEVCVGGGVGRVCQIVRGTEYWRTISNGSGLLWLVAGTNKVAREGRGDRSEKGI